MLRILASSYHQWTLPTHTSNIIQKATNQTKLRVSKSLKKPPCCNLALAKLQLLAAPSHPDLTQKKSQRAVGCAPSGGEVWLWFKSNRPSLLHFASAPCLFRIQWMPVNRHVERKKNWRLRMLSRMIRKPWLTRRWQARFMELSISANSTIKHPM